jgi:hypothetical protein
MSWSVQFIGTPENIVKALEDHSTKIDGYSKQEYDEALPYMVGLVKQNFNTSQDVMLRVNASGHAYSVGGEKQLGSCQVAIEQLYGVLV